MTAVQAAERLGVDHLIPDEQIVQRVLAGETELYELIMRRHNQRLYRAVLSVLGNDSEVEAVMQDAYVAAYTHLDQFAGRAKFSTWLTRIAVHEALARRRRQSRFIAIDTVTESDGGHLVMFRSKERDPEQQAMDRELRSVLEASIAALPQTYRSVFVLRDVEGLDTGETAECLAISEEAVKTRLHRARALVRKELYARTDTVVTDTFQFHLSRCDRVVDAVFRRIAAIKY